MSEPFSEKCVYCGSPDVLDDTWFCAKAECWEKEKVVSNVEMFGFVRCAGYYNPRPSADYSPIDKRVWLSACRERDCPDDRCLNMLEPTDPSGE